MAEREHTSGELTTRCTFCGYEFTEEEGAHACGRCALFGGCRMVKCPRCGYEMPQTPNLVKMLKKWGRRGSGTSGGR